MRKERKRKKRREGRREVPMDKGREGTRRGWKEEKK